MYIPLKRGITMTHPSVYDNSLEGYIVMLYDVSL